MRFTSCLRFLGLSFFFCVIPALAAAQDSLKCESNDGNRQYCGTYRYEEVRLDQQISESPCVEGQSWGVDRDGLWVDRGCRAIFSIRRGEYREGPGGPGRVPRSVSCASDDGNRRYCDIGDYRQVRLDRQISGSACVEGDTWGVDRRGLWVDRGCRAIFTAYDESGGGGPRYDDRDRDRRPRQDYDRDRIWWDPDPSDTWPPRGNWHGGRWESGGACFYKDRDFHGAFFCLRRGESRDSLGDYGNDISSIRVFGRARAIIFDDRNFNGSSDRLRDDVSDLRSYRVRGKHDHTWNNRISSIRVE
jgi:hypothetical protein